MKQIKIIVLAILVLATTSSFAQKDKKDKKKPSKIGIRFGHQSANLIKNSNSYDDFPNLSTFYIGTFKYFNVVPFVKFGTGLEFFQSGTVTNNNNSMHLYYISSPLNLRVKFGPIYALGGIAPSIKVAERWEVAGEKITPDSNDKANWFDAPLYTGLGFKVLMFSFEARYHWGTVSLYNSGIGEGYKNRYFQLGVGISL